MNNVFAAAAIAASIVGASASTAGAKMEATHRYGHWTVFQGTTNSGAYACAISVIGAAPEYRFLGVRYIIGDRLLTITVSKESWYIPKGTRVPLEIEFAGFPGPWRSTSGAHGEGNSIILSLSGSSTMNFLNEFKRASGGVVRFGGNEGAWTIDLTGSNAAANEMLACIGRAVRDAAPTQPYTATPPTSPTLPYTLSTEPPSPSPNRPASSRERRT